MFKIGIIDYSSAVPNGLLNGLISYWKADTNGSFPDVHGSNNGTILGASFLASAKINGGYSYVTNDYVNCNVMSGITFSTGGWFRFNDVSSSTEPQRCISERQFPGEAKGWYFRINNTTDKFATLEFYPTGGGLQIIGTTALTTGVWYHIGISINDVTKIGRLFINGVEDGSSSFTGTLINGTGNLNIGRQSASYFDGDADEHPLYNRELTSDEWLTMYNGGAGLSYDNFTT